MAADDATAEMFSDLIDHQTHASSLMKTKKIHRDESSSSHDMEFTCCQKALCVCAATTVAVAVAAGATGAILPKRKTKISAEETTLVPPSIEEDLNFDQTVDDIVHYTGAIVALFTASDVRVIEKTIHARSTKNITLKDEISSFDKSGQPMFISRPFLRRIGALAQAATYTKQRFGLPTYERIGFGAFDSLSSLVNRQTGSDDDPGPIPVLDEEEDGKKTAADTFESSVGHALFQTVAALDSINDAAMTEGWEHLTKIITGMVVVGTIGTDFDDDGLTGAHKRMKQIMSSSDKNSITGCVSGLKYFTNLLLDMAYPEISTRFKSGVADIDILRSRCTIAVDALTVGRKLPPEEDMQKLLGDIQAGIDSCRGLVATAKDGANRTRILAAQKNLIEHQAAVNTFLHNLNAREEPFYMMGVGPPGTGKSTIAGIISDCVHHWSGLNKNVFHYKTGSNFHDGARNCTTEVRIEEGYQNNNLPPGTHPALDIISFKNTAPFMLRKANLTEKENTFANFAFINQIENVAVPKDWKNILVSLEALVRRPDFVWEVGVDKKKWPQGLPKDVRDACIGMHPDTQFLIKRLVLQPVVNNPNSKKGSPEYQVVTEPDREFPSWISPKQFFTTLQKRLKIFRQQQAAKFEALQTMRASFCKTCSQLDSLCVCSRASIAQGIFSIGMTASEGVRACFDRAVTVKNIQSHDWGNCFPAITDPGVLFRAKGTEYFDIRLQWIGRVMSAYTHLNSPKELNEGVGSATLQRRFDKHVEAHQWCCMQIGTGVEASAYPLDIEPMERWKISLNDAVTAVLDSPEFRKTLKSRTIKVGLLAKDRRKKKLFLEQWKVTPDFDHIATKEFQAWERDKKTIGGSLDAQVLLNVELKDEWDTWQGLIAAWPENLKMITENEKQILSSYVDPQLLVPIPTTNLYSADFSGEFFLHVARDIGALNEECLSRSERGRKILSSRAEIEEGGIMIAYGDDPEPWPEIQWTNGWTSEEGAENDPMEARLKQFMRYVRLYPREFLSPSNGPEVSVQRRDVDEYRACKNKADIARMLTRFYDETLEGTRWSIIEGHDKEELPTCFYMLEEAYFHASLGRMLDLERFWGHECTYMDEFSEIHEHDVWHKVEYWKATIAYWKFKRDIGENRPHFFPMHYSYYDQCYTGDEMVFLDRLITRDPIRSVEEDGTATKVVLNGMWEQLMDLRDYVVLQAVPSRKQTPWFATVVATGSSLSTMAMGLPIIPVLGVWIASMITLRSSQQRLETLKSEPAARNLKISATSILASCGIGVACMYILRRLTSGSIVRCVLEQGQGDDPSGKAWSWLGSKPDLNVTLTEKAQTTGDPSVVEKEVGVNTFTLRRSDGHITVLLVDSNYGLVPAHFFDNRDKILEVEAVQLSNRRGMLRVDLTLNSDFGVKINEDTILMPMAIAGARPNLGRFFPEKAPTGSTGVKLLVRREGLLQNDRPCVQANFAKRVEINGKGYPGFSAKLPVKDNGQRMYSFTEAGDCGSPYIALRGDNNAWIAGMHRGKIAQDGIIATTVTQEDLRRGVDSLRERFSFLPKLYDGAIRKGKIGDVDVQSTLRHHPKSLANFLNTKGHAIDLGHVEGGFLEKNPMRESPLVEVAEALLPSELGYNEPAVFSKRTYQEKAMKTDRPLYPMDLERLERVISHFVARTVRELPVMGQEMWATRYEVDSWTDFSTSAGPGHNASKRTINIRMGGEPDEVVDEIWERSDKMIERLRNCESSGCVFGSAQKAEMRAVGKSARIFTPGTYESLVTQYRLFGRFLGVVKCNPFVFNLAIGLDMQGIDGDFLYDHLNANGEYRVGTKRTHATDYKGWDERLNYYLKLAVLEAVTQIMDHLFDLTDEDRHILDMNKADQSQSRIIFRETLLSLMSGLPSGTLLTSLLGGLGNEFTRMYGFDEIYGSLDDYDLHVAAINMGDDGLAVVRSGVDFPARKLGEVVSAIGMELTSSQKGDLEDYSGIYAGDFLNRLPVYIKELQRVVWAISPSSLVKAMQGILPSTATSQKDQLYSTIMSLLTLTWPHGEEIHEAFRKELIKWCKRHDVPQSELLLTPWSSLMDQLDKGTRVDNPGLVTKNPWRIKLTPSLFRRLWQMFNTEGDLLETVETEEHVDDFTEPGLGDIFAPDDSSGLGEFNERWVLLDSLEVLAGETVDHSFNPLERYMEDTLVKSKTAYWNVIRGNMEVRLSATAPQSTYGMFQASFTPMGQLEVGSYKRYNIFSESVKPSVMFGVGRAESVVTMTLPMCWNKAGYNRWLGDLEYYGRMRILSLCALDEVFPTSSSTVLRIYVRMSNMSLSQSTFREEGPKPSEVLGRISGVANAASRIIPFPAWATGASVVSEASDAIGSVLRGLGMSRPNARNVSMVSQNDFGHTATADAGDVCLPLGATMLNSGVMDPRLFGCDPVDELSIDGLARRPILAQVWEVNQDDAVLRVIGQMNINPGVIIQTGREAVIAPCAVASIPFGWWNGECVLTFRAVCASQHALKLQLTHDPTGDYYGLDTHKAPSAIWDIRETTEFEYRVKWNSEVGLLNVRHNNLVFNSGESFLPHYDNGVLTMFVNSPLQSPGTTDSVKILVFVHFENLFVAHPLGIGITNILHDMRDDWPENDYSDGDDDDDDDDDGEFNPPGTPYPLPGPLDEWGDPPDNLDLVALGPLFLGSPQLGGSPADTYEMWAKVNPEEYMEFSVSRDPYRQSNWAAFEFTGQFSGSLWIDSRNLEVVQEDGVTLVFRVDGFALDNTMEVITLRVKWSPTDGNTPLRVRRVFVQSHSRIDPVAASFLGEGMITEYTEIQANASDAVTVGGAPRAWSAAKFDDEVAVFFTVDDSEQQPYTVWFSNRIGINDVPYEPNGSAITPAYVRPIDGKIKISRYPNETTTPTLFAIVGMGKVEIMQDNVARRLLDVFYKTKKRKEIKVLPVTVTSTWRDAQDKAACLDFLHSLKAMKKASKVMITNRGHILEATVGRSNYTYKHLEMIHAGEDVKSFRGLLKRSHLLRTYASGIHTIPMYAMIQGYDMHGGTLLEWINCCFLGIRGSQRFKAGTDGFISARLVDGGQRAGASGQQWADRVIAVEAPYYSSEYFVHLRGPAGYPNTYHAVTIDASNNLSLILQSWGEDTTVALYLGPPPVELNLSSRV